MGKKFGASGRKVTTWHEEAKMERELGTGEGGGQHHLRARGVFSL